MEKDQVVILDKRGTILISGEDSGEFLQNIITNDIYKVSNENSIFTALLTPQGKYFNDFVIVKDQKGFLLDCCEDSAEELIENLSKYKLRSKVEIKDVSSEFAIGVINYKKFQELHKETNSNKNTILYRNTPIYLDPRNEQLGARIFSNLEKLYLTIKKLNLKIVDSSKYYSLAHTFGIPEKGLINLKDQLFGLEANFEELNAIDFKKGCYIGQENTARMKLKEKLRRRLLPIYSSEKLNVGEELFYNKVKVGKILIDQPYPFGLIKVVDPNIKEFENTELLANTKKCKILKSV